MGARTDQSPAELYEEFFGPALFAPWAAVLVDVAAPRPGERVLDLACGTGIVARRVAGRLGPADTVVGVDASPAMLDVARRRPLPGGVQAQWHEADAAALDLPDGTFDVAVCQQGFQFFRDRAAAARELRRVLTPGGRAALATWRDVSHHPLLAASTTAVARHLGVPPTDLDTPFSLGDAGGLAGLLEGAGFEEVAVAVHTMDAVFPSAHDFLALTTVAAAAVLPAYAHVVEDPAARAALVQVATEATGTLLEEHRDGEGLRLPWSAHLATGRAPAA